MSSLDYQTIVDENQRLKDDLRVALKCIKVLNEMKIKVKTIIDSETKSLTEEDLNLLKESINNCNDFLINYNIGNNQLINDTNIIEDSDENIVISETTIEISEANLNSSEAEILSFEAFNKNCRQMASKDNKRNNKVKNAIKCPIVGCLGHCGWDQDMNRFKEVHRIILNCPIFNCSEAFVGKSYLDEHLMNIHQMNNKVSQSFICCDLNCKQSFDDYNNLLEHISLKHKDCARNKKSEISKQSITNRIEKMKDIHQGNCNETITSSSHLEDHDYYSESLSISSPEIASSPKQAEPQQVSRTIDPIVRRQSDPPVSEDNPLIVMIPKTSDKPPNISSLIKCPFHLCESLFIFEFDLSQHCLKVHQINFNLVKSLSSYLANKYDTNYIKLWKQELEANGVIRKHSTPNESQGLDYHKLTITKIIESKTFALVSTRNGLKSDLSIKCIVHDCGHLCKKKMTFNHHMSYVHECPVKCCRVKVKSKDDVIDHIRDKHFDDYPLVKCSFELCDKHFIDEKSLKAHIDSTHVEHKCSFVGCGKLYKTSGCLRAHMKALHSDLPLLKCDIEGCDFETKDMTYLAKHKRTVHSDERPFVCDHIGCGLAFKSAYVRRMHKLTIHTPVWINCPYDGCDARLKKRNMSEHIKRMHRKPVLYCKYSGCHYSTRDIPQLNAHKRAEHPNEYLKYICNWNACDKRFADRTALREHIQVHKNEKEFGCDWPECEFRANCRDFLLRHIRNIHKPDFKHSCHWPGCDKKFKTQINLKYHLRVHTNEKPFVCDFPGCNYRSGGSYFYEHRKKHFK